MTILEIIKLAGCKDPQEKGDFYRTNAVWRKGEGYNVSINKETGYWKDFVAQDQGNIRKFCELCGITAYFTGQKKPEEIDRNKIDRLEYKRYDKACLKRLRPIYTFYLKRGISKETVEIFGAGVAFTGRMYNRICFPIYDSQNTIIGFSGRKLEADVEESVGVYNRPKWLHHGPSRCFLFPAHLNDFLLKLKKEIILVESIGDVLALFEMGFENCLCLFGINISPKLMAYLLEISPRKIIISTNNDIHGRAGAARIRKKLKKHFVNQKIKTVFPVKGDWAESLDAKLAWKKERLT